MNLSLDDVIKDNRRTALGLVQLLLAAAKISTRKNDIWLHTNESGTHVRALVPNGQGLRATKAVKSVARWFPVQIIERSTASKLEIVR